MRLICADPGISEAMIRFDAVSVAVLHGDRAFIRHHLGCLSDR